MESISANGTMRMKCGCIDVEVPVTLAAEIGADQKVCSFCMKHIQFDLSSMAAFGERMAAEGTFDQKEAERWAAMVEDLREDGWDIATN